MGEEALEFWGVVEGRRSSSSSSGGVSGVCFHLRAEVSMFSEDQSHVSTLSMFTAPHACMLVFTALHCKGHYCLCEK